MSIERTQILFWTESFARLAEIVPGRIAIVSIGKIILSNVSEDESLLVPMFGLPGSSAR